jgi:hypothetical protein
MGPFPHSHFRGRFTEAVALYHENKNNATCAVHSQRNNRSQCRCSDLEFICPAVVKKGSAKVSAMVSSSMSFTSSEGGLTLFRFRLTLYKNQSCQKLVVLIETYRTCTLSLTIASTTCLKTIEFGLISESMVQMGRISIVRIHSCGS